MLAAENVNDQDIQMGSQVSLKAPPIDLSEFALKISYQLIISITFLSSDLMSFQFETEKY